jgi:hypothetical protein
LRPFDGEARFLESRDDVVDRGGVTRLALDLDHGVLGGQAGEDSAVVDLDDVDAGFRHLGGDRGERARLVVGGDVQPRDTPLANEVADEDVGEQVRVDIAAAQNGRDLPALESRRVGEHRREPRRAGALDHRLFDSGQHRHRTLELALGDEHHVAGEILENARGQLAGLLDRDAFGQGVAAQGQMAALDRAFHRRVELGLDADHGDVGLDRPGGDRHARHQPAAADRHDDRVEVGRILEHLEPDRAGAGDDLRVVERMDEHEALFERQLARLGVGVVKHVAVQHDGRAVARGLGDFHGRRRLGHDDGRRDAEPLGMISDGLRMVAGRSRDHAARALLGRQLKQFVERAAFLVGGGELQILELEPDFGADELRQRAANQHRRADDGSLDALGRGADVVDGWRLHHRSAP